MIIGQAGTLTTAVENVGSAALDVTMVNLCLGTSGEFSFSPSGPFTVAAGASRTLTVTYTPADTGPDTGCLQLASNDPDENPIDLNVAATGAPAPVPDINLNPSSLDFGSVVIGQAGTLAAAIENVGTANLEVTMVNLCSATSAEFSWAPAGPFTIAPGMSQSLNVTYTPTNTGQDTGCLQLASNDPDESPIDLNVMGTGAQAPEPDINLSPSALDFG